MKNERKEGGKKEDKKERRTDRKKEFKKKKRSFLLALNRLGQFCWSSCLHQAGEGFHFSPFLSHTLRTLRTLLTLCTLC